MGKGFALFASLFLAGCGTMISGPDHLIHVDSEPRGAKVTLLGSYMGETPLTVAVPRRGWGMESAPRPDNPTLVLELPGYVSAGVELRRYMNPATWLNLLNLGLGMIVDGSTGAFWAFWPDRALVRMTPLPPAK